MPPTQTIRRQIIDLLSEQACTARDLSQAIGVSEKEVYTHIPHIARSVAAGKQKLVIIPSRCLLCDYIFDKRTRFTRPSRCPLCKGERIEGPKYEVV